jgi:hypothetical protein
VAPLLNPEVEWNGMEWRGKQGAKIRVYCDPATMGAQGVISLIQNVVAITTLADIRCLALKAVSPCRIIYAVMWIIQEIEQQQFP